MKDTPDYSQAFPLLFGGERIVTSDEIAARIKVLETESERDVRSIFDLL